MTAALATAVLFPVFAKPHSGKDATLIDGEGQPMAGIRVGLPNGTFQVTDDHGQFSFPPHLVRAGVVPTGYGLSACTHHTGGNPSLTCQFSPIGRFRVRFVDEQGRPLTVPVGLNVAAGANGVRYREASGEMVLGRAPLGIRTRMFRFRTTKPGWRLWKVERHGRFDVVTLTAIFRREPNRMPAWSRYDG